MSYRLYPCGDHAITIQLGDHIDAGINNQVISLFTHLRSLQGEGIKDIIPSYHTVTVVYDLLFFKRRSPSASAYETVHDWLREEINNYALLPTVSRLVRIPVCYDTSLVSDMDFIAGQHGLSAGEVIDLHVSRTYRVYLIGFLPGFAYMGSVDERIATPRRISPRVCVPAGSVGIAGEQTGIYPFDSPGGWQLLGQTPLPVFNADQSQPCLLQPGDEVRFYPITLAEFKQIKADGNTYS